MVKNCLQHRVCQNIGLTSLSSAVVKNLFNFYSGWTNKNELLNMFSTAYLYSASVLDFFQNPKQKQNPDVNRNINSIVYEEERNT